MTFFARVCNKLGAREPVESAIMLLTAVQITLGIVGIGILKIVYGYVTGKTVFLMAGALLVGFNLWYLSEKASTVIGTRYREPVSGGQVLLGIALYFLFTVGLLCSLIPLAAWLR
ncbi:hypothetical protein [Hymenobacter sp. HDW8]|uniref:hypothetical protein n=1 Tax=Hymenobacter sp. HDW8 TaxID=2714932 RepID=UPI0014080FC8|nr:hypothetical protein [Hymenobacter sp. HDW8]QIL77184.1 hypothetical protein G7064_16020 [Hymenobacter sp. HDW8]